MTYLTMIFFCKCVDIIENFVNNEDYAPINSEVCEIDMTKQNIFVHFIIGCYISHAS